ncbi:hypothetical protein JOQ06_010486 [Pogonophryne albipinna]|uniref:Uncharacterized protein n=1 Tax=Pogonophryne albipinna TaxID=1090488 RepID=A0AAD6AVY7_9TELE|nr:hypothetical protein JOQ06_010486 [Pogonophryne albipinna]
MSVISQSRHSAHQGFYSMSGRLRLTLIFKELGDERRVIRFILNFYEQVTTFIFLTGLDMYWLKQGDTSGTAGFESLAA